MTSPDGTSVETLDLRDHETIRWGLIRALFPNFVEQLELGRYLQAAAREAAVSDCSAPAPR